MTTHFWAVPKIGTPAIQIDIDPEALGRNYPLVAMVNGDAKVTLAAMREARGSRHGGQAQAVDRRDAGHLPGVVREVQRAAALRPGADPSGAHVRRPDQARAGRRDRDRRHRPCRHVDGRHVRSAHAAAELLPLGRPSRLGVLRRHRRQGRLPRAAGRRVHRRRGLLVPHRRDRDRGALEAQQRHGGEQQCAAATRASAASTAPMAASRPSRRASCGPTRR